MEALLGIGVIAFLFLSIIFMLWLIAYSNKPPRNP